MKLPASVVLVHLLVLLTLSSGTVSGVLADTASDFGDSKTDLKLSKYEPGYRGEDDQVSSADEVDRDRHEGSTNSENDSHDNDQTAPPTADDPGSQFNTPSYIDADFQKKSFKDLKYADKSKRKGLDWFKPTEDAAADESVRENVHRSQLDRPKPELEADDDEAEKKVSQPPADVLYSDWVPSKAVRQNNGGFGTAEDNGAPVPYRMSGHLNIERGFPWNPSD
ncbi:MAG: hypothetical protein C5B53_03185 [Candidatus Melainabacteria bacterium]|nr:MAG: hypothetical protein C5B53_03185 [Candidatus Melainabacteria bacterium]